MKEYQLKYRPDIDGLRAIAVMAVVLFHLDYSMFKGGYIGVDVFFVISGFLISQIVYSKVQNNNFSFKDFYKNRALRILPVLFVLIIFCILGGFFILLSDEYSKLGVSSIASVLFIPNILFWFKTGYFEIEAESTPLLHIWSLGVEEQFYILFPLFVYLFILKFNRKYIFGVTSLLVLVSFYINIKYTSLDITYSFYMLFSRAWELLVGFLLTLFLQHIKSINNTIIELSSIIGICLIIFPVYFYDTNILFPGYYAVLPVLGSMLVIFSGSFEKKSYVKKMLSNRYIVFIGLISYSLYLWHWPIIVYLKMAYSTIYLNEIILLITFLISVISYIFIEKPFRNKSNIIIPSNIKFKSLIIMGILISIFSFAVIYNGGIPARLPDSVKYASNPKVYLPENRHCHRLKSQDFKDKKFCTFGHENTKPTFALLGDSHAEAFKYGLKLAAIQKGKSGVQFTKPGCRPIKGIDKKGKKGCLRFIDVALNEIVNNDDINTVFLAGYWSLAYHGFDHNRRKFEVFDYLQKSLKSDTIDMLFIRGLHRTLDVLIKANKKIVIVGDTPIIGFNPRTNYARNIFLNKEQDLMGLYKKGINNIIKDEVKVYGGRIEYMSTEKILCPNNPCQLVKNNILLFRNDDHITRKASAMFSTTFENYL